MKHKCGSQFSHLHISSRDRTQVARFAHKHLYPLSLPNNPCFIIFLIAFIFDNDGRFHSESVVLTDRSHSEKAIRHGTARVPYEKAGLEMVGRSAGARGQREGSAGMGVGWLVGEAAGDSQRGGSVGG